MISIGSHDCSFLRKGTTYHLARATINSLKKLVFNTVQYNIASTSLSKVAL